MSFLSRCYLRSYSKLEISKSSFVSLRRGHSIPHKRSLNRTICLVSFPNNVPPSRLITTSSFHPAGHSHYDNIRHIKAAKDQAKHGIINRLVMELDVAIRDGKSSDPTKNNLLSYVIQKCKRQNVPKATIDRVLNKKRTTEQFVVQVSLPGSSQLVVVCMSTQSKNVKHFIANITKRSQVTGSVQPLDNRMFTKKRIILTTAELDGKTLTEEEAIDLAIDAGSEEVSVLNQDEENSHLLKFVCADNGYTEVEKAIEDLSDRGLVLLSSKFEFLPIYQVDLNEHDRLLVEMFIQTLHKQATRHDTMVEITDVFHNVNAEITTIFHT